MKRLTQISRKNNNRSVAPPSSKSVTRIMYRGLLRLGKTYDKFPLLKLYYASPDYYVPNNNSFCSEIRKAFRKELDGKETKEQLISNGFFHVKKLSNFILHGPKQALWHNNPCESNNTPKTESVPIKTDEIAPGNILLAHPFIGSYSFSTILILDHSPTKGTIGVLLDNKYSSSNTGLSQNKRLWVGGPLLNNYVVLHTKAIPGAMPVTNSLYYTQIAKEAIEIFRPYEHKQYQIYTSYFGWGADQLENELKTGCWILAKCPQELLFDTLKILKTNNNEEGEEDEVIESEVVDLSDDSKYHKHSNLWKKLLKLMGGEYEVISVLTPTDLDQNHYIVPGYRSGTGHF